MAISPAFLRYEIEDLEGEIAELEKSKVALTAERERNDRLLADTTTLSTRHRLEDDNDRIGQQLDAADDLIARKEGEIDLLRAALPRRHPNAP